jgi:DNA-binding SARP family transcriptional activator
MILARPSFRPQRGASMSLAIHLLGTPRIERDGQTVVAPRGRKCWALLAYLLLCDARCSREHLAHLLFADADDSLGALRWNLSELRRALGPTLLRGEQPALELPAASYVDVRVLRRGAWFEAVQLPALDRQLLEGMNFADSPAFEVWLASERRHLQATGEAVLREATLARMAAGAAREAADLAARLVARNPLDESYQALLVRSLAMAGDGMAAARQAAACRELFQRELGVQPGRALADALRTVTGLVGERPPSGRGAALAQLEAGQAAIAAGATDAGLLCLRRAVLEADATGDPVLRGRTRVALGGALVHAARGCDEEGATSLHEALAVGAEAGSPVAAAAARELGYVEFLRGQYERAFSWLARARTHAGDDAAERARIASVEGSALSDTAHYPEAIAMLEGTIALALEAHDRKQLAYALSMLGRAQLFSGRLDAAQDSLDRSIAIAQQGWTAFLPWPQALRADIDLARGDDGAAGERLEHAYALSCQIGDPCWESISARGLGRVAQHRGDFDAAATSFMDAIVRSVRLPDAYVWTKAHALDALSEMAVARGMPRAIAWVDELQQLAARCGMREFTVRAHLHRAQLGDVASGEAALLLASAIDSPALLARAKALAARAVSAGPDSARMAAP